MEKVLVYDDENEEIHYIKGSFLGANKTLCGQRLHPISTTYVKKIDVTCKKCLEIVKKIKKKHIKELDCTFHANHSLVEIHNKINELVKVINELLEKEDNNANNKASQ